MRVLRMLMHLSLGHVTLLRGKIRPSKLFPKSDGTGRPHVGLCPKFLVALVVV